MSTQTNSKMFAQFRVDRLSVSISRTVVDQIMDDISTSCIAQTMTFVVIK